MDTEKLYELQDRIRKNAISKKDNLKIVEDLRGKNSKVPGEPANVLTRVTPRRGDKKIVFYQKSPGVIVARLYNIIDSAEPFDLKPEVSQALQMIFESAANVTPKQFKEYIENDINLKKMAHNPTLNMVIDAFYEVLIAEPRYAYEAQEEHKKVDVQKMRDATAAIKAMGGAKMAETAVILDAQNQK